MRVAGANGFGTLARACVLAGLAAAGAGAFAQPSAAARAAKLDIGDGNVALESGGQSVPAKIGSLLQDGDALRLGANSHVRLTVGDQAVIEAGPLTVLRILSLGQDRTGITTLRLEQGLLRLVWADPDGTGKRIAAISFGKWAARVSSGEFVFEAGPQSAKVCGLAGEILFAGTGYDAPPRVSGGCTELSEGRPPVPLIPSAVDWQSMREQFVVRSGTAARPKRTDGIPPSLQVEAISGTAQASHYGAATPLAVGQVLEQGQRLQTGTASGLRASYLGEGTIELGAETRATVRKLPTDASNSSTWVRLDDGTAMVRWQPFDPSSLPLEISFSHWAAKIDAGEFFIAAHADHATVCRMAGEAVFSGVPETLPKGFGEGCVELSGDRPARTRNAADVASFSDMLDIAKGLRAQLPKVDAPATAPQERP